MSSAIDLSGLFKTWMGAAGVDVERDAMLVVERALTSLHTRAEAPAAAASSAAPRNDFPVANLFGASPTAPKGASE
jgi:hypothetical protein